MSTLLYNMLNLIVQDIKTEKNGLKNVPLENFISSVSRQAINNFIWGVQDLRTLDLVSRLKLRVCNRKIFFLFLNQKYVVGTQKNRLNETVL